MQRFTNQSQETCQLKHEMTELQKRDIGHANTFLSQCFFTLYLYQLWRGEEDESLEDVEEVVHGEAAHQLVEVLLELLAAEHHDGEDVAEQTEAAHTKLNN